MVLKEPIIQRPKAPEIYFRKIKPKNNMFVFSSIHGCFEAFPQPSKVSPQTPIPHHSTYHPAPSNNTIAHPQKLIKPNEQPTSEE